MHAVGEHVLPVRIGGADPHVIRHDVEEDAHVTLVQRRAERAEVIDRTDLRIHARRIDDVVSMHAPPTRRENGRAIEMGDAKAVEIRNDAARGVERELLVQLYAIRCAER